ncbi:MAG: hypothetical protein IIA41_10095 [SAR324 cluster bacterium]|nr:hypothetical protein [SAR324 cluster bacterium]
MSAAPGYHGSPLDEALRISAALAGVADLLNPDGDIQALQRDHIAILLDVLLEQLASALERAA